MPMRRRRVGRGQIYAWPGGSLWIGTATGGTDLHAHHAIQVTLAAGDYRLQTPAGGWTWYRASLVPGDAPHAFHAEGVEVAHIFVEPESRVGRCLLERYCAPPGRRQRSADLPIVALDAAAAEGPRAALFAAWSRSDEAASLVAAAQDAAGRLAGAGPPVRATDPRVLRALEIIAARLAEPLTLGLVAREVHLSPSRLRHLFVAETGLPLRRYVLWQRLQRVFAALATGSLTEAAHAAGFADSAHMTRTFRRMLGIAPTSLEMVRRS